MMTLFDAPSRESSCIRREPTSTALQSLALFNETQRVEMARTLAQRLLQEKKTDRERLELLYRMLASRSPNSIEAEVCTKLLGQSLKRFKSDKTSAEKLLSHGEAVRNKKLDAATHAAWTQVCVTVLASDAAIMLY